MSTVSSRKDVPQPPPVAEREISFAQRTAQNPERLSPLDQQFIIEAAYSNSEPYAPRHSGVARAAILICGSAAAWGGAIALFNLLRLIQL